VLILPTAYLAPVRYYAKLLHAPGPVTIDLGEHYIKQSLRNRCRILGPHGPVDLSIPVLKRSGMKTPVGATAIDPTKAWQHRHWQAIRSAYGGAPYFEHYAGRFEPFYRRRFELLWEFNETLRLTVLECLRASAPVALSRQYVQADPGDVDLRHAFSDKPRLWAADLDFEAAPYEQVFAPAGGFAAGMSILDLLFCEGPGALGVIRRSVTGGAANGR